RRTASGRPGGAPVPAGDHPARGTRSSCPISWKTRATASLFVSASLDPLAGVGVVPIRAVDPEGRGSLRSDENLRGMEPMPLSRSQILRLRSLRDKAGRREHGHYLAEGIRVLEEALRHGALPKELFVVPERLGERGVLLVRRFRDAGIDATEIDSTTLDRFADARTPQGAIGV